MQATCSACKKPTMYGALYCLHCWPRQVVAQFHVSHGQVVWTPTSEASKPAFALAIVTHEGEQLHATSVEVQAGDAGRQELVVAGSDETGRNTTVRVPLAEIVFDWNGGSRSEVVVP